MIRMPLLAAVVAVSLTAPNDSARLDLTFAGGTLAEYIDAIRARAGDVNIIHADLAKEVMIEPVELKQVSVDSALRILHDMRIESPRGFYLIDVDRLSPGTSENYPVYRVETEFRPGRSAASSVWMLAAALDQGLTPEDVLTAIEANLELFGPTFGRTEMRFHQETGILVARGHPDQIVSIDHVVGALLSHWAPPRRAADEAHAIELAECRVRAEMLEAEVEHHRRELASIRADYDRMVRDRDAIIRQLESTKTRPPGASGPR